MNRDVNAAFARALVDEWARAGLTDAALAPGSRSTPLALALAADDRVRLHVHLDERSASFFALGAAKASGRPAAVLCTSGTAAAHFHAAVLEARHARVPLLVCTADRPVELRDTGAPQTSDQVKLYGGAVRFFAEMSPEDHPAAMASWRPVAARAYAEAAGPPAGPVHLNLAFREPLVPHGDAPEVPGRPDGQPWVTSRSGHPAHHPDEVDRLAERVRGVERGLVVAGWGIGRYPLTVERFAWVMDWPVLADPLSGIRTGSREDVTTYEALLRIPGFPETHRPDLVLRLGGPPTSKVLSSWLDASVPQILFDPEEAWLDPGRACAERLVADPTVVLNEVATQLAQDRSSAEAPSSWLAGWIQAEHTARQALDEFLDASEEPFEGRVARDVSRALDRRSEILVVASSMPVRDLDAFADRGPERVFANRGLNGIDGFPSTVFGVAAASQVPTVGLCGDLAFLHDAAGLMGAAPRPMNATLVVVDNDGGGIFSFLPQAGVVDPEPFEALFGTPHGLDLVAVADTLGVPAARVNKASEVVPAVRTAIGAGGVHVIVVPTGDRSANVTRHRLAWEAVAQAVNQGR